MTTYVALLRAVNVGGANRIKMDRLRVAFVGAGYPDAVTHIQSGNVVFASTQPAAAVKRSIEALIVEEFGLAITAIVRTQQQLAAVTTANPFLPGEADLAKLHVAFLDAEPTRVAADAFVAAAAKAGDDEVRLAGREVFIRYSNGAGRSKLTATVWKRLGVDATARNWKVTANLAELAASHQNVVSDRGRPR